jgi:O-antigen/teichoic acid export membrane protein
MPAIVGGLLIFTTHIFLCAGLLIHKTTLVMARLMLYAAALNIGLNCLLLPRIGLQGAAIATLLSYTFYVLLLGRASFRLLPLNIRLSALAKYLFASAVTWATVSRIEISMPILSLLGRSVSAVILYVAILYVLDSRVRSVLAQLLRHYGQSWHGRLDSPVAEPSIAAKR